MDFPGILLLRTAACAVLLAFLCPAPLAAQALRIARATGEIRLDGVPDEEAWRNAEPATAFHQNFPADSVVAASRTEVRLAYDERFLYLSAVCRDSLSGPYVMQSLKRDFSFPVNDGFAVFLDAFNDRTTGLNFTLNPWGVQREGLLNDGGQFGVTTSWDGKWFGEAKRFGDRWTLEMAIPFKTLRFKSGLGVWRINFARNDLKRNEMSTWVRVPRNFNVANLAFTGELHWDVPPRKQGRNVALIPYLQGSASRDHLAGTPEKWRANAGLDAKVALTSALNLDLTVNPDFSQVDVDQQQLNIDRFELFFPERRIFFLENSDLFSSLGKDDIRPFFSRRIGLNAPILGGVRLSGKLTPQWRVGALTMQTEGISGGPGSQNHTALVLERQVLARSTATVFALNRQGFQGFSWDGDDFNRLAGAEFNYRTPNGRVTSKAFFHHAWTASGSGFAAGLTNSYEDTRWSLAANIEYLSSGFRADMGFTPRLFVPDAVTGQLQAVAYGRFFANAKRRFFFARRPGQRLDFWQPELEAGLLGDGGLGYMEHRLAAAAKLQWLNTASIRALAVQETPRLYRPFLLTGLDSALAPGRYAFAYGQLEWISNKRRPLFWEARISYGGYYSGQRLGLNGLVNWRRQPWGVFGLDFSQQWIWMPEGFGRTSLTLIGPRFELAFARNLFLTTYFQYNTQTRNVNLNARLWWRFAPMSDLFLVYTDNAETGSFATKNRGIVLKVNYWFTL
jgi:hypothetical protein